MNKTTPFKTYYSYSRLWCWLRDPQQYYRQYVLKMKDEPTDKMILGSIFSDAYADPKFDYRAALVKPQKFYTPCPPNLTFTPDFARNMEKALSHKKMLRLPKNMCEQTIKVESKICPLLAKHDGRDAKGKNVLIIENKYGTPWTEEKANTEDQITFYAYVDYLTTGKIPLIRLQSVNSKNGEVVAFEVNKTKEQFVPLEEKIAYAYNGIIKEVYERQDN